MSRQCKIRKDAPAKINRKPHPHTKVTQEMLFHVHACKTAYNLSLYQCCAVLESVYNVQISRTQLYNRLNSIQK